MRNLLPLLLAALIALPAAAQVPGTAEVGTPVIATTSDAATFAAFGGLDGLRRIVDDGVERLRVNPVIAERFRNANIPLLKQQLTDQFCALLGGPCSYSGPQMSAVHQGMNIRMAEFNALVEDFEQAMTAHGVPYRYQTRLLAKLAPMQREVLAK